MQLMFTSNAIVTNGTATNSYYGDASVPRGIWEPWPSNGGSFDTADKWITVTVPLSKFNLKPDGTAADSGLKADSLTGLTFFVWNGTSGEVCSPVFAIDNIRVVPVG